MVSSVCAFFKNHPFSNWWMSDFVVDGVTYNCGEQWMMAQKALLFEDRDIYDKILQNKKPDVIKRLGRLVKNFDEGMWNEHRYELVKKRTVVAPSGTVCDTLVRAPSDITFRIAAVISFFVMQSMNHA